jgi:hypothetical protein
MFTTRRDNDEFTSKQFELRELIIRLNGSSRLGLPKIVKMLDEIVDKAETLRVHVVDTYDEKYFDQLFLFFKTISLHVKYIGSLQSGEGNPDALNKSVEFNLSQLKEAFDVLSKSRPSSAKLIDFASEAVSCLTLNTIFSKIDRIAQIQFPFINSIETNPYAEFQRHVQSSDNIDEDKTAADPLTLIISVQFSTDNEPWANPQVLLPNRQYTIQGKIKLSYIPKSYTSLFIRHVSTTNDDFFILSIPEIKLSDQLEYNVSGHVIFKYAQNTFDPAIAIKIIAQLISPTEPNIYPHLIGYDELISKVIDDNIFKFPTGYNKLNKKASEIVTEIKAELTHLDKQELEQFTILLSALLNYSGYCSSYGIYKCVDNINEDQFRDRIIAYMSANPMLTSSLVKEGHIAGGRIEIRYHNIIAELKVEKNISDRKKMLDNYTRQPIVYASALSADLAILCILDLTPKSLPSASAANNVFTISVPLHGFESEPSTSKVVAVIIDGNLKNPSSY